MQRATSSCAPSSVPTRAAPPPEGITAGRTGAVNRIQRIGSLLNVHYHALILDGAYTARDPFARPVFHEASELEGADLKALVETIRTRVLRLLRSHGLLTTEGKWGSRRARAAAPVPGSLDPGSRGPGPGCRRASRTTWDAPYMTARTGIEKAQAGFVGLSIPSHLELPLSYAQVPRQMSIHRYHPFS